MTACPVASGAFRRLEGLADDQVVDGGIEGVSGVDGPHHQQPAVRQPKVVARRHDRNDGIGVVDAVVESMHRALDPEARNVVSAVAEYRNAKGFKSFQSRGHIEHRLDAAADDNPSGPSKVDQIGGFIERRGGASMNATNTAGGEHLDTECPRDGAGSTHRRRCGSAACH